MMRKVYSKPGLTIEETLVISDLHIGLEKEIRGIRAGTETKHLLKETLELLKTTGAEELVILGDLKHNYYGAKQEERRALSEFIKQVPVPITLLKGNHDSGIEEFLEIPVISSKGFRKHGYWMLHGHALPPEKEEGPFLAGHSHPAVKFTDKIGGTITEKAWVEQEDLIIMPAFNPLIRGIDITERIIGPLKHVHDPEKARITLLDGLEVKK